MKKAVIITVCFLVGCTKVAPLKADFDSIRSVVDFHTAQIAANDSTAFTSRLVTAREFHDSIYSHLPEAKDASGRIDENVYWGWLMPDRLKSTKKIFAAYGGLKLTKLEIGEAKKVIKSGSIRIHRDIPVYAEFQDKDGKGIQKLNTTELFKAIVEVNGRFKLWNMNYE